MSPRSNRRRHYPLQSVVGVAVGTLVLVGILYFVGCLVIRPLAWTVGDQLPPHVEALMRDVRKHQTEMKEKNQQWLVVWCDVTAQPRDLQEVVKGKNGVVHTADVGNSVGALMMQHMSLNGRDRFALTLVYRVPREWIERETLWFQYDDEEIALRRQWRSVLH